LNFIPGGHKEFCFNIFVCLTWTVVLLKIIMHRGVPKKGINPLDKRVPRNEKYSHVRGTLDTGMTVDKVKFVTAREYSKRRDEIFFRITKHQLYQLLAEYEMDEQEDIAETTHNTLKIVSYNQNSAPVYDKPYLILDVREMDAFNEYHILQARSFPYTMLRRDQIHPEVYRFRNKPESLIIVCCEDEKISRESAKVLVDRGVDNVYLLTGGIHEFACDFPSLIEGFPPAPPKEYTRPGKGGRSTAGTSALNRIPEDEKDSPSRQSSSNSMALTPGKLARHNRTYGLPAAASSSSGLRYGAAGGGGGGSPGGKSTTSNASRMISGGRDNRSESGVSTGTNKSVAESIISRAASRKGKF